jgi:hypothetical protein
METRTRAAGGFSACVVPAAGTTEAKAGA